MKRLALTIALALALVPCAFAEDGTQEFTVSITGDQIVYLSKQYRHFAISVSSDMTVRFMEQSIGSNGVAGKLKGHPAGNPAVPRLSGPRPDIGDTTHVAYSSMEWNTYNDTPAVRLNFHASGGPYSVTIKAKN